MNYLEELNPSQRAAVECIEGPSMIIAGAGSGKTRVITYRIVHLLNHGADAFNILTLTFTNKAAREMKERIAKITGEHEAKNLWTGTFHSIFSRILRVEADKLNFPQNFSIYDTDDSRSLLKTIIKEMNLDEKIYKPNVVHNRISSAKNNLISATGYAKNEELVSDDVASGRPKLAEVYLNYQKRLFKAGAMDFDDLLFKTYELFERFPDVLYKYQQRFKFIMVDEYQDTNFAQYTIVKKLAALFENICVVGDDAQSIYAFRGADIQNILNFERDYPDLKTFKLEQNYRSTKTIVESANAIIAKNKYQLKKTVYTDNETGERIAVYKALTDNEEGRMVAQAIFEERMLSKAANKEFAILYRTNSQSRSMEEALRKLNIPYRIYGGVSFYQRKEIKDLLAYFRLSLNPKDEEALKRVINYPARGIGNTSIEKLVVLADKKNTDLWTIAENITRVENTINSGTRKKISDFSVMIQSFGVLAKTANAYDAAHRIAAESGVLKDLYTDRTPEGVSRYENIQELLNGIKEFTEQPPLEEGTTNTLDKFMAEVALYTDADNSDDEDDDRVNMMTIHASKGLEFPYVFIVGLEENLFPSQLSVTSREELEEERRLFYVALTRAMKKVSLSFAQSRYRWGQITYCEPSRFLAEMDQTVLDVRFANTREADFDGATEERNRYSKPSYNYTPPPGFTPKENARPSAGITADFKGDNPDSIQEGMEVEHARFGNGLVKQIEGKAGERLATIHFEGIGDKKILLKFAKLKIKK
ncbi:MAG: UvrD-helicase domain-containing protein [Flavobacteriales bacterium]|nr:UvrD-helicase domain-containing protein [Flavobacteriales bacterium]